MNERTHPPLSSFQTAKWPDLEKLCLGTCPCCGEQYNEMNLPDLASRCHPGEPVWAAYWQNYIYLRCAQCDKPICRVPVSTGLI